MFAIFALLVFVDPLFAVLAIGSYVIPRIVLYVLEDEPPVEPDQQKADPSRNRERPADRTHSSSGESQSPLKEAASETDRDRQIEGVTGAVQSKDAEVGSNGDSDPDSDDGDANSDTDNGDTDSDSDDGDTDSDS